MALGKVFRTFSLPTAEMHARQSSIYHAMLATSRTIDRPNFTTIGDEDLERLIRMYDDLFFDGRFMPVVAAEGITFGFSKRMTSIAGELMTTYPHGPKGPRRFKLRLSSTLLFQTFKDVDRPIEVTGRRCKDRLEAMQRVAEHEMTHLLEILIFNGGNCSEPRFQDFAKRSFGHTDYRHRLMTQRERAAAKFDIRVGDFVEFVADAQRLYGRVNRITRRATVLVPDPKGVRFTDGKKYRKFYVPLERLKKVRGRQDRER